MGQEVVDYGSVVNDGTGDVLNVAFAKIDAGSRLFGVIDKDLTAPPGSPAIGDCYIVGGSATGDWATHDGKVAVFGLSSTWLFIPAVEGMFAYARDEDRLYRHTGSAWSRYTETESFIVAVGDETTPIAAGAGQVSFRMPYAFTLTAIRASLVTAQATGSVLTVDVNETGASVLSTKITFDNTEKTTTTAATPPVISDADLADDAEITIDVDQIGDGTAAGLKIALIGRRA